MAEDLTDYLKELGVKVQYLHSEVDTLERVAILRDLRLGVFDVLVGINLLREGIDLPEVTLVAILDADKEGFLRSAWSLIQMIGRAARNTGGEVIMYADRVTESMQVAIDETDRRRTVQEAYNVERGIEPTTIIKGIRDINERLRAVAESTVVYASERTGEFTEADRAKVEALVGRMEAEMKSAAKQLEFERAAALRDEIQQIRLRVLEEDASITVGRAAERAAKDSSNGRGLTGAADRARGRRGAAAAVEAGSAMEVTSVTVLAADEEPADNLDGRPGRARHRPEHRRRLAARHPRRARGRGRLAGALARPADLGPDGHARTSGSERASGRAAVGEVAAGSGASGRPIAVSIAGCESRGSTGVDVPTVRPSSTAHRKRREPSVGWPRSPVQCRRLSFGSMAGASCSRSRTRIAHRRSIFATFQRSWSRSPRRRPPRPIRSSKACSLSLGTRPPSPGFDDRRHHDRSRLGIAAAARGGTGSMVGIVGGLPFGLSRITVGPRSAAITNAAAILTLILSGASPPAAALGPRLDAYEHLFQMGLASVRLATCPRISSSCAVRANTTSRTSTSRSRATGSSSSPVCRGAASRASPSTRSTPRASAATSRA